MKNPDLSGSRTAGRPSPPPDSKKSAAEAPPVLALTAEEIHAAMYPKASQAVDDGKDVTLGPVQICENFATPTRVMCLTSALAAA